MAVALFLLAAALIVAGCVLISLPLGFIVAGVLALLAWFDAT